MQFNAGKMKSLFSFLMLVWIGCHSLPHSEEMVLVNGLRVVLLKKDSPITSAVFLLDCTADVDPRLTDITSKLLLRGTEVRSSEQIHQEVESLGGRIGAETGQTISILHVQAPEETFSECFTILCECITQPTFDEEQIQSAEFRKPELRSVLFEDMRLLKDDSIREMLFYGSPLGNIRNSDQKPYSREEILKHYKFWYRPTNMVLAVVGRFRREEILRKVSSLWTSSEFKRPFLRSEFPTGKLADVREKRVVSNTPFDRTLIGFRAPSYLKEPFFVVRLLEVLLASGENSLLPHRFRSEGKTDYEARAYYHYEGVYGYFVIAVDSPPGCGDEARCIVFDVLDAIKNRKIPIESLEIAKRKILFEFAYRFQFTFRCATFLAASIFYNAPYRTFSSLEERIVRITPEEVQRGAEDLFAEPVVWISQTRQGP